MDLSKVGLNTEKKVAYPWFVKADIDGFFLRCFKIIWQTLL